MPINIQNPNQRTPCVLVLDASGSMDTATSSGRRRIDDLNAGIEAFYEAIRSDDAAYSRVSIAVVVVGGPRSTAELLLDWTDAESFETFSLSAGGGTPIGAGMLLALELVENAKRDLRAAGITYTRPWIIAISDGEPTDDPNLWARAVTATQQAERDKKAEVFTIGVQGADLQKLGQLSQKPPAALIGIKFKEFFVWLSDSLAAASRSRAGENIELPSSDPWRHVGL
jgi:uncharacterized protein YegL